MKKMIPLPKCAALALGVLAASTTTHAQTDTTWTRGAGNGDWNNATNWSAGVPVAGFNAIFGASVGGDPSQIITLAMDKITFASGAASHTAQFQNWNVNAAGTFLEVQSGNTQAQTLAATRNGGGTILLKSGTSTILNNGSNATGLLFGQIVAANSKLTGASGANSTLVVDGSGITTIGIGQVATATNMVISDGSSGGVLSLTKNGTGTLNLNSANTFSGGLTLQGTGAINLSHSNAAGTGTIFLKSAASTAVTTLGLSGGITVANAIQIDSTTGREGILSTGTGNNSLTGGITITGAGNNAIFFGNNQSSGNLTVSNGISGASYANQLSLRGSQSGNVGFLNGAVTLASNALFDNNGATSWTLNTAGSTWGLTYVRSSGNLILGANNALATSARVVFDVATSTGGVDLNGFNQTVAGIETTVTPTSGNGGVITNSSATTDSTLTLAGLTANRSFAGTITDGATRKVSLVMNSSNRTQTLTGTNTYTGDTTVSAGTLNLGSTNGAGSMRFVIGGNGTNTAILGSGTTVINGQFVFDLSGASTTVGHNWTIVAATLTNSYGTNFLVTGFNGSTVSGLWTNTTNGATYVFAQSNSVLTVQSSGTTPYSSWLTNYPSLTGTNTNSAADPDGDGFINGVEFAFGGNPTTGTPALLQAVKNGTNADFTFIADTNSLTYTVRSTTNLASGPWTNATVTVTNATDQGGVLLTNYIRRQFTVPASGSSFYKVESTPVP